MILRPIRLIQQAIQKFDLNLRGLTILTEAGSGHYIFTPFIAALAGAAEVIAITGDSRHASAKDVRERVFAIAKRLGVDTKINTYTEKTPTLISRADIVTNLGFVRPIDKAFISHMKLTAVIPLMFETWEFRNDDVDIKECIKQEICLLGTNEEDERLRTFEYLGHLCAKVLLDNGVEVFQSKLMVIGGGKFGCYTASVLRKMNANIFEFTSGEGIGPQVFEGLDAIITADHEREDMLIGRKGCVRPKDLKVSCPDVIILNLAGSIDRKALDSCGIRYLPEDKDARHMGWTLAQLGPKPVIDLHTAGLKVGEILARLRVAGLSPEDASTEAQKNSLCQGFQV